MKLSLRVVQAPVSPDCLQGSIDRLNAIPGIKLGLGRRAEPLLGGVRRFRLLHPKPGGPGITRRSQRLSTAEQAETYPLSPEMGALVLVDPTMDELVAAHLLLLRATQCCAVGNWGIVDARSQLTVMGRVRLSQIASVVNNGMADWSSVAEERRPAITPLEALYYSCCTPGVKAQVNIGRIDAYLASPRGGFDGWEDIARAGRYRSSSRPLATAG